MQEFTLKEIADRNGVSKSTVKAYTLRHGIKPVDTSGSAYKYPEDLMTIIADKYAEPANSKKLFDDAIANTESKHTDAPVKQVDALTKRVDQLIDFASWWAQLDDQRMVPMYFYRFILRDKAIRTDKRTTKIMAYFGDFSLDPRNKQLRDAVTSGTFRSFVGWVYKMLWKPTDIYMAIQKWNKFSSDGKTRFVQILDDKLSKHYENYCDFKTGGAGGRPLAEIKADSATGSDEPDGARCKSALLAPSKDKGTEA